MFGRDKILLTIRREQMDALTEDVLRKRAARMAQQILSDFADELADRNPVEFEQLVGRLVRQMISYGFKNYSNLYRLVSWGVFFGENYLNELSNGELARIAARPENENNRFSRILAAITPTDFMTD